MRLLLIGKFVNLLLKRDLTEYECVVLLSGFHFYARVVFTFLLAVAVYVPSVLNLLMIEPSSDYTYGTLKNSVVKYSNGDIVDADADCVIGDILPDRTYRVVIYFIRNKIAEVWTVDALKEEYLRSAFILLSVTIVVYALFVLLYSRLSSLQSCILWVKYCHNKNVDTYKHGK